MDIKEYILLNPYPSYDTMVENIENNLVLWSEYGKMNHIWCKEIYENPNNKDLIIEIGKKIYNMGGKQSLIKNLKIITDFSPYNNIITREQCKKIEEYFQNILN